MLAMTVVVLEPLLIVSANDTREENDDQAAGEKNMIRIDISTDVA